jgi:integrase
MAKRYQHLIDSIRHDVARQVGGLLWVSDGTPPGGGNDGAATALDPVRSKAE